MSVAGGAAGSAAVDLAEGDPLAAANHRRSVRALVFALAVVGQVLAGGAWAAIRSGSGGNGFLAGYALTLPLAIATLAYGRRAEARVVDADGPLPDEHRARLARKVSVVGIALAGMLIAGLAVWASIDGLINVGNTFFSWKHIASTLGLRKDPSAPLEFGEIIDAFKLNIFIFLVAEVLVLPWALLVALARRLPGAAAAPVRWASVAYVDTFRGLPAVLTIFLIVFGLPLTKLPLVSDIGDSKSSFYVNFTFLGVHVESIVVLGIGALVLVYGAYVAEVYRAGIESIHWSQRAAARGLGLSEGQAMRFVVIPQAVRRVIPPLMNDFIGLQKDTALLALVGVNEAFNIAQNNASNTFNLSAVTGVGLCFLVITIPMTRLTDVLVKRDQQRKQAGAA
jgi:polar amino acid transport system permease protein